MSSATVICDASFYREQKGPPRGTGVGGWAAWVRIDHVPRVVKGYGSIRAKNLYSSTEAEVYAALNGIWLALQYGATDVLVRSDCMTVCQLIDKTARVGGKTHHVWWEALKREDMKVPGLLSARHVKGHSKIVDPASWVNDWADRHARKGMIAAREGRPCSVML